MAAPRDRIVLLFCHGGSFNEKIWTPILQRIKRSPLLQSIAWEHVAFDFRYHGLKSSDADAASIYYQDGDKSSPRVEHPGRHFPEWAPQDLLKVVKLLRHEDAALHRRTQIVGVGHSMGAATLLNVEVYHPGTFAGLILFEPPFAIDERPEGRKWAASMMVVNTLTRPEEWNTWEEVVAHFKEGKAYRRWHPESLAAFLRGGIKKTSDGKRFRLAMPLMQEASLYCHDIMCYTQEEIARVKCNVVFEFGDHTQLFDFPRAHELAERLPEIYAVAEPLEGKTHLTVVEDPDTCAAHIVQNLAKFPVIQRAVKSKSSKL